MKTGNDSRHVMFLVDLLECDVTARSKRNNEHIETIQGMEYIRMFNILSKTVHFMSNLDPTLYIFLIL